mgnify:CR=1 FL=1
MPAKRKKKKKKKKKGGWVTETAGDTSPDQHPREGILSSRRLWSERVHPIVLPWYPPHHADTHPFPPQKEHTEECMCVSVHEYIPHVLWRKDFGVWDSLLEYTHPHPHPHM